MSVSSSNNGTSESAAANFGDDTNTGSNAASGKVPEIITLSSGSSSTTTTTTTHSNGTVSNDEVRTYESTILVQDTPSTGSSVMLEPITQPPEVVPDSNDGVVPLTNEGSLFGRSAATSIVLDSHPTEQQITTTIPTTVEINLAVSPAKKAVGGASANPNDDEPDTIILSSSTSANTSADDIQLRLEPDSQDEESQDVSTKPKSSQADVVPKTSEADKNLDAGKKVRDEEKPTGNTKEDETTMGDDIEEPIKVKYITPLGESGAESGAAETSAHEKEVAAEDPEEEEKETEGDHEEDEGEESEGASQAKRTPARGRGRGRHSRRAARGRVTRAVRGRKEPEKEQGEDEEEEKAAEASADEPMDEGEKHDADEEAKESGDKEEMPSTTPKRKRRSTADTRVATEAKSQEPEKEGRVLRNRLQSPPKTQEVSTPRKRRARKSTTSEDEAQGEEAEKPEGTPRRKRAAAAKASSPEPNEPSTPRHQRSKRARVSSAGDQQQQRSASSDSEPKEEKRTTRIRTRGADTPAAATSDHGESSKATATAPKKTPAGGARGGNRRRRGGGAGKKRSNDPFDFDDKDESQPAGPFRSFNLSKSNFGDMKFTKAEEKTGEKNKYIFTSKAAELRKGATSDTIIKPDGTKVVRELSPDSRRRMSPEKSLSSGNMADVSSFSSGVSSKKQDSFTRNRSGGARNTQSSRRSGGNRTSSSGGSKQNPGSASLFSDGDMDDEHHGGRGRKRTYQDDEDEESGGDEVQYTPSSSKRRRQTTSQVTPKPKTPEAPVLTPDEQLHADFSTQNTIALAPGARVLARWKDKCFYPASVMVDEGLGHYSVLFYDGALKKAPRPDLVPVAQLKPGDVLMVNKTSETGDSELEPVKILATPPSDNSEDWHNGIFEVENEVQEQNERVSWQKFVIDAEQTKHYVSTSVNKAAQDITADNITEKTERVARTRGGQQAAAEQQDETEERATPRNRRSTAPRTPRTPRSARGSPSSRRSTTTATSAQSSSSAGTPSTSPKRRRPTGGASSTGSGAEPASSGRSKSHSKRHQPPQIFAGYRFVLTSANRRAKENEASEEERPSTITFNKKHVRQLIEDHGGAVVDEFSVMDLEHCFLIADTHYRTHKYLSALARAVPCVKHTWIHESCAAKELLDHHPFMLAAGYSLENDKILPWHDKCPNLLADKSVLVYTENRPNNPGSLDFVQIWAPLVKCMGANVIETAPNAGTDNVDILLTDATCSPAQLQAAESRAAKAVSSEWLIQAIITGRQPRPDGHKKYEYDYVETSSGAGGGGDGGGAGVSGGAGADAGPPTGSNAENPAS